MRALAAVRRLARHAPELIADSARERYVCVLATAVGIDALARVGIHAEPWPCRVVAANRRYLEWLADGGTEDTVETARLEGAHMLDVGHPEAEPRANAWRGHLIVRVPAYSVCIDLNVRAFSRPEKGIPLPPSLVLPWAAEQRCVGLEDNGGSRIEYHHTPENTGYVVGPDWAQRDRAAQREIVDRVVRAIRSNHL